MTYIELRKPSVKTEGFRTASLRELEKQFA